MLKVSEKFYHRAMLAILIAVSIVILLTFRHYGITWDEELQSQYGQAVVDYYFSGLKDMHYAEIYNLYLYGGMFDGFASLIDRYTPTTVYETRHLVNAFFGLLGLWGTWRLGRLMGGGAVGFLALIFLTLTPVYYGHMFNNPKDIPFAAGIVWALYFMARCFSDMPRPRISLIARLGVILGLTLGVRVGGVMAMIFWLAPMTWDAATPFLRVPSGAAFREMIKTLWHYGWRLVLPVGLLAYGVMLLCWPWAQQAPITNPLLALNEFKDFPHDVEVLLNGTTYMANSLPWFYVPLYFAVQLPELILMLVIAGVVLIPFMWREMSISKEQATILLFLMAFAPPLYAVIFHPPLYDAVRHFLFVVPLVCVIAAMAAKFLYEWAISRFYMPWSRRVIAAGLYTVLALFVITQVAIMEALHPYEYIYANQLTGGVPGAYGKFELDYWGTSFKEAAKDLQAVVAKEGGVPPGKIYRVAICGPWDSAMIYLPPDYEPVVANEPAEFFLSTTRWMCQNMRPGKEIIRIERMGVPLAVIKDLRAH
jgi:hypothetical protein